MSRTTTDTEALLRRCYAAFNARDLEGALAVMHLDVTWPNGCIEPRAAGGSVTLPPSASSIAFE